MLPPDVYSVTPGEHPHIRKETNCAGINEVSVRGVMLLPPFVQSEAGTLLSTGDTGMSSLRPICVHLGRKKNRRRQVAVLAPLMCFKTTLPPAVT